MMYEGLDVDLDKEYDERTMRIVNRVMELKTLDPTCNLAGAMIKAIEEEEAVYGPY